MMNKLRWNVTDQRDLFYYPTEEDLEGVKGSYIMNKRFPDEIDAEYLTAPKYDTVNERWTCLANMRGCLCLVEINIYGYNPDQFQ
jgi:hypothetical protein